MGMWIKAQVKTDGIHVFWQQRVKVVGGRVQVLDANGEVESDHPYGRFQFGDLYKSCGVISVNDDFVEFCGEDNFDEFVDAVALHVVNLVALGYGETPDEVVGWFNDLESKSFIVDGGYLFRSEHGQFAGLIGRKSRIESDEAGELTIVGVVGEEEFKIPMDTKTSIISFVLSTVPF